LAILAAILMIVLASLVRSRLDANGDSEAVATEATGNLVCVTELRTVCERLHAIAPDLQVRVEDMSVTSATLTNPKFNMVTDKVDAWLVPQPVPTMVTDTRQRAGSEPILDTPSKVLARSPVVLTVWHRSRDDKAGREETLQAACGNQPIAWPCLGTNAGRSWTEIGGLEAWGRVKPGHPSPGTSATGLLVLAQASGAQLGRADYARQDLFEPEYLAWLTQLEQAIPTLTPSTGSPLAQMLSEGPSTFDAAGSIEALAGPSIPISREKDRLSILYPSPVATADVVLAPVRGSESGGRVKNLLESDRAAVILAENGWRVPGQPVANGVRADLALPDGNGLPGAGVLAALLEAWSGAIR
jgi:Bacterial extracellular solute-binding protein